MTDAQSSAPTDLVPNLRDAIRRARLDDAERSSAIAELRGAEIARLEILAEALGPVLAQIPEGASLFDHGLVASEHPRFYVDILAFVEMARDKREYRFLQDSRWGQRVIAETDNLQEIVKAVTNYVALRLVEREKALDADRLVKPAEASSAETSAAGSSSAENATPPRAAPVPIDTTADPLVTKDGTTPSGRVQAALWFLSGLVIGAAGFYVFTIIRPQLGL